MKAWSAVVAASVVVAGSAAGAAPVDTRSYGDPAENYVSPSVRDAFVPLSAPAGKGLAIHGSAVVVAPGVAVTNAHNANLIGDKTVIGKSAQYDLLFFRIDQGVPLPIAAPREGENVLAYGEGFSGELRMSYGPIRKLDAPVKPVCPVCIVQQAFTFESNAGPGFSGGPVLDAQTGQLVGITFGYVDDAATGVRLMYAYDMARVNTEFAGIQTPAAVVPK